MVDKSVEKFQYQPRRNSAMEVAMRCIFCDLYQTGKAGDFTGKHFWARLDIHPVSPGHLLIIPKRHVTTLDELRFEEREDLEVMRKRAVMFVETLGRKDAVALYEQILDARITKNSVLYVQDILADPRLGTEPDGYNFFVNQGAAAGQTVEHLHYHVAPRYTGDMPDPRGGARHAIPDRGNYNIPRTQ